MIVQHLSQTELADSRWGISQWTLESDQTMLGLFIINLYLPGWVPNHRIWSCSSC